MQVTYNTEQMRRWYVVASIVVIIILGVGPIRDQLTSPKQCIRLMRALHVPAVVLNVGDENACQPLEEGAYSYVQSVTVGPTTIGCSVVTEDFAADASQSVIITQHALQFTVECNGAPDPLPGYK